MRRLLLAIAAACPLGAQPSVPAWTVSSRPTLDIGSESNTQTQFNGVAGILRMSGGEIVVANGLSQELRVFSPAGNYVRTLTLGSRVGTMRSLDRVWRGTGDTIYAAEILPAESNVWTFTLNGAVSKRQVGASNAGGVYPVERFPDGRYAVSAAPRRSGQAPAGLSYLDSVPLGIISVDNLAPKWIAALRNEMVTMPNVGRRGGGRTSVAYPYGRSTSVAISSDRLWVGDSETGTITQYDAHGRGLMVFAAPTAQRALDTATIRRVRSSLLSDAMNWNDRARIDASYSMPFPRNAPRFTRFLPGLNGEMWIESFREDPAAPRSYSVVSRTGTLIAHVTLPRRVNPLLVRADEILGVLTDEEGLEHVVSYTLRRR